MKNAEKNIASLTRKKLITITVIAGLLLMIANSAIWINQQFFNSANFTSTVTSSLRSESSRLAIAQDITDEIYADRPVAKRIAGNFTVNTISGLLNTEQFNNVLSPAVEKLHVYATSNTQEDVVIDLGGINNIIDTVVSASESLGREINVDAGKVPDSITLVREDNIPDLYKVGLVFLWLAPISTIIAAILLVYPYIKQKSNRKYILLIQGIILTIIGILSLLIGPLFKPAVLAQLKEANSRVYIGNLYDAFIKTFVEQTSIYIFASFIALISAIIWYAYPQIRKQFKSLK